MIEADTDEVIATEVSDPSDDGTGSAAAAALMTEPLYDLEPPDVPELLINGEPVAPARPCEHRTMYQQAVFGIVEDDETHAVVGWQVRIRVRCGACGLPFDIDPASARDPRDSPIGVVLDLAPVPEDGSVSLPIDFDDGYASPEGPQGGSV